MSDHLPDPRARAWFDSHTYRGREDPVALEAIKSAADLRVSVCLPALNEASTIRSICTTIRRRLIDDVGLVDELMVIDSGSNDGTDEEAAAGGAVVVLSDEDGAAPGRSGKGSALRTSLVRASGDIIVWLDADTLNLTEHFIARLVAPLLRDRHLLLVKAFYERPLVAGDTVIGVGGGRVTELAVRPLLNLFYPALAGVIQPLAGECALRREPVSELDLVSGYGVEVALLIDLVERWGLDALAQADLGIRIHRNRDVMELGRMSFEIIRTMLQRFEDLGLLKSAESLGGTMAQFRGAELHLTDYEGPLDSSSAASEEKESPPDR